MQDQAVPVGLRALADPLRWRICDLLAEREMTVGELCSRLGSAQPLVSHHLGVLRRAGLVTTRRMSYWTCYRLVPERWEELCAELSARAAAARRPVPGARRPFVRPPPPRRDLGVRAPLGALEDRLGAAAAALAPEFAGTFSRATVERYLRDSLEHFAAFGPPRQALALATAFARQRLQALARAAASVADRRPEILYVCERNAGRSQIAAALTRRLAGGQVGVRCAGSAPAPAPDPVVVAALAEVGADPSGEFPKPLTREFVEAADVVVTMGCGDACPVLPGKRYLDWELDDPAGRDLEAVRGLRDRIGVLVAGLLDELGLAGHPRPIPSP